MSNFKSRYSAEIQRINDRRRDLGLDDDKVAELKKRVQELQLELERRISLSTSQCNNINSEFSTQYREVAEYFASAKREIDLFGENLFERLENTTRAMRVRRDESILEQIEKIKLLEVALSKAEQEVSRVRNCIVAIKGQPEDENFAIDCRDRYGNTFLMVAALRNDTETAKICLQLGAEQNEANVDGFTAMSFATYFKFGAMVKLLEQSGAATTKEPFDAVMLMPAQSLDEKAIN